MATPTTSDASGASSRSLKLHVDTNAGRVLYAEASKDVVDFLFSLLALPVGTVAMLLGPDAVAGSVGGLYRSFENLERSYAQPGVDMVTHMDALLRPPVPRPAAGPVGSLLGVSDASARPRCPSCCGGTPPASTQWTVCQVGMVARDDAPATGGFVQGNMTYTVMDDLAIAPWSTDSVLNALDVWDLSAVKERTVQIGNTEALNILKASLESKTVLTDVFVRRRAPPAPGMLAH